MGDVPRDADFGMKSREGAGVLRKRLRQEFDGDDLAELQIFGAIDLAHSSAPGECYDAITLGHDLPRYETPAPDRIGAR